MINNKITRVRHKKRRFRTAYGWAGGGESWVYKYKGQKYSSKAEAEAAKRRDSRLKYPYG